ncbi:MAG TPA: division/cell wall cluster transcriptional repressor MraZ [Actinomycetes bacterium]|jgi:MraZ protein|nr:division/cell wall cluster transcriptional repressor MraZ [Actinomycetes bacterium]
MFIGSYDHSLDPKGRVILPRKFRDELGQDMVFTKGIELCLYVFPLGEFEAFANKLRSLPLTERPSRDFVRIFVAGASQESADSQGRVVIPQALREYAGLSKDVVIVGQLSRIEIWDREEWGRYMPAAQAAYSDSANAAHLAELGI